MPTFIDESGDTGWEDSSKEYFRLTAVWLPDKETVAACRQSIKDLWPELGLRENFAEFKFAKTDRHPEWRSAFFRVVLKYDFKFAAVDFGKCPVWGRRLKPFVLHKTCLGALADALFPVYAGQEDLIRSATDKRNLLEALVVDDNGDKGFLRTVKESFATLNRRDQSRPRLLGSSAVFKNHRTEPVLMLADMLCGAAGKHFDGESEWFDVVRSRCVAELRR